MREFISVIEEAWKAEPVAEEPEYQDDIQEEVSVVDMLSECVFKLRAHSEPMNESLTEDAFNLGVESGCEMAAEMIENIIRQLSGQ